ncbi:hypothetical protein Golob_006915 [Gossypium lobatum]|uniref:Uncharacterized protein n=1 Tax=Gossypium lobatum TaxID=34289 RepID=A0A7J8NEQ9_9ROSI|nr:hypothetical protein [Gossypium lobatum]
MEGMQLFECQIANHEYHARLEYANTKNNQKFLAVTWSNEEDESEFLDSNEEMNNYEAFNAAVQSPI